MSMQVVMPQLGESIVEATLVRWLVAVGDTVTLGQTIAEVETDKATSEIPAPKAGSVTKLLVAEGSTVDVGTPIAEFDGGGSSVAKTESPTPTTTAPTKAPARLPSRRLAPIPVDGRGGPIRTSPAVRRLARRHDLDVSTMTGTGRGGRVTRDDVLAALEAPSAPPPVTRSEVTPFATVRPAPIAETGRPSVYRAPKYAPKGQDRVVPFSRRRKWIAEHMVHSLGESAHVAAVTEIDMSRVFKKRAAMKGDAEARGIKLTFLPFVVASVADALATHPELNASVVDDSLVLRADRNIGIAVDTPEGLVVCVVPRADELGLMGIARQIQDLSTRAHDGTLTPQDVADGSFTISNPGRDGNLFGVSILRQPEVGILRMGAIVKRPVVREIDGEDAIVVRPMMYACLSYDHRVVDGRVGNAFLAQVARHLSTTA